MTLPNTPPLATAADYEALVRDANRWRALLSSGRLRWQGSSGFDFENKKVKTRDDVLHFGMDFWNVDTTPPADNDLAVNLLTAYADDIVRRTK